MVISSAKLEDSGRYECVAESTSGHRASLAAQLLVAHDTRIPETSKFTFIPADQQAFHGSNEIGGTVLETGVDSPRISSSPLHRDPRLTARRLAPGQSRSVVTRVFSNLDRNTV